MKIFLPINDAKEVVPLVRNGASEFYCGFVPPEWSQKYGYLFSLNRREAEFQNLRSYQALKRLVESVHKSSKEIYLTFNATFFPGEVLPLAKKIILKVLELGVDGLIIADLGLLIKMKEWGIKTKIILSGDFGLTNNYALDFLRDLPVTRIIFQRFTPIEFIKKIISNYPQYEYEAFIMNEKCPFAGSYCFSVHGRIRETFCSFMIMASHTIVFTKRKNYSYYKKALNNLHAFMDMENTGYIHDDSRVREKKILPAIACGLCSIYTLKDIGINVLKIVGRGTTFEERMHILKLVNKVVNHNYKLDEIKKMYSENFMNYYREQCDLKLKCY